jgi:CheY-like chemotaxis protein
MRNILVIEDDSYTRDAYEILLDMEGYHSYLAANGIIALTILATESIDLIFSDGEMPQMNGYNILKAVKANAVTAIIPFILTTGHSMEYVYTMTSGTFPDALLIKPFDITILLETIQNLLKLH